MGNLRNRSRFVAGLVCLLALFVLVPNVALAEGDAVGQPAVAPDAKAAKAILVEAPPFLEEEANSSKLEAPVDPLEGAIFLLPRPNYPCPVTCEANACTWFCADSGGIRGCVNGCCVCY